jgi:two-component system response regulator TctD
MAVDPHKRVLLVDDEPLVREMLTGALRSNGLTVDEACDGAEALGLMAVQPYSVILLDLLMPNVDGFAVLEAMAPREAQPVVIVITGADHRAVGRLNARWIHGVVRKPFDPQELARVVTACADIRGRNAFGAMAVAAMVAGSRLIEALLSRWTSS